MAIMRRTRQETSAGTTAVTERPPVRAEQSSSQSSSRSFSRSFSLARFGPVLLLQAAHPRQAVLSAAGVAAAAKDDVFVTTRNYVFEFDLTTWGWIHLVFGIVVAIVGGAILAGQKWALVAGIELAMVSALLNFLWLLYYPAWAIIIIAFDIAVIWALSTILGNRRH